METGDRKMARENTGRFILDTSEHRVMDADSSFFAITGYHNGARFEEIFEKSERAVIEQHLTAQVKKGAVGSFTARLRQHSENRKTVCVFFEYREMLSGALRLYGVIAEVDLPETVPAAQPGSTDVFTLRELKKGIDRNEFILYVQPLYDLNTGKVAGGEILPRWIKNDEEILPSEFFSQLGDASIGCELDYHVFSIAMPKLSELAKQNKLNIPISFNISEEHFRIGGFAERVEALAEAFEVNKRSIMFEIKSEMLEAQDSDVCRQLADLREEGFRVVVDGTRGDSRSLLAVESGVVDYVKMERAFISHCADTEFGRDLLQLLLATMKKSEIQMICTGVETSRQRDFLKKYGCNFAQGYFFARPIPLGEFADIL